MRRRRFLHVGGASLAGLAGCLSFQPRTGTDADGPDGPDDGDASPTQTTAATGSLPVAATATALQPAVVRRESADSFGTWSADGSQYLYVEVAVDADEAPASQDLRLRFDGTDHEPVDSVRGLWRPRYGEGQPYDAASGKGWLLFDLPATGNPDEPTLTWPGSEVAVSDDVAGSLTDRLAEPSPRLSFEFEAPDVIERGNEPDLLFTVTNVGTLFGRFVAALNRSGPLVARVPLAAISRPIPPGETERWTVPDTYEMDNPGLDQLGDGEPDVTYYVNRRGSSLTEDLRLLAHGRA